MISVIIPTRNRADLLSYALGSLTGQTLAPHQFEVLAIDNGSTDHTASVVRNLTQEFDNLRYIHEPEPGLHAGRHRGMLEAKGDLLVFADDDIEALPTWLASIKEAFADPDVAMVGGNNLPRFLETPPDWLVELWERPSYGGGRSLGALSILELPHGVRKLDPFYVWGCNFAIRKKILLQAGGFHPDGMPRELIHFRGDGETHVSRFVAQRGLRCVFHSGASVFHKVTPERMTYQYFRRRGFSQGISDSYTELRGEDSGARAGRTSPYRVARWVWGNVKSLVCRFEPTASTGDALKALKIGHCEGYTFHQKAYQRDPKVREWVHRRRYF